MNFNNIATHSQVDFMLFVLPDLFSRQELENIRTSIETLSWRDGKLTAGKRASSVKKNEQAVMKSQEGMALERKILKVISSHPIVSAVARPKRFSKFMISRTRTEGGYGHHIDNAIMGSGEGRFRADISFTLFLSAPKDYEGGALEIEMPGMVQSLKPDKGTLVIYPSNTIHRVTPVTSGERIVCVGWIETMIRNAEQREVLLDLENLRAELGAKIPNDSREMLFLNKTISNLLRMWAEV